MSLDDCTEGNVCTIAYECDYHSKKLAIVIDFM